MQEFPKVDKWVIAHCIGIVWTTQVQFLVPNLELTFRDLGLGLGFDLDLDKFNQSSVITSVNDKCELSPLLTLGLIGGHRSKLINFMCICLLMCWPKVKACQFYMHRCALSC